MAAASFLGPVVALALLLLTVTLGRYDPRKPNPRHPRKVPAVIPIPFIGHMLGIFIYRNHYYTMISEKWNLPIISLPMFGSNVYVIRSPELVYSIQRQPKSLSFWYFEAHFTAILAGFSEAAAAACVQGVRPEATEECPIIELLKDTKTALSPNGDLNRMTAVATKAMHDGLEGLLGKRGQPIDLESWIRHEVLIATTDAVYGTGNPYHKAKVQAGFWKFANATLFMALPGILPKILAPRAVAGREALARAMAQYYAMSGHHNGSQLTMARYSVLKSYMNDVDIARAECVHGLAVITNIVPAAFWTVYHVFSDPDVLSRVREELESLASIDEQTPDRKQNCVLDMSKLKDAHFLNSVIHETLRFRAGGTGPRMVLENVILSGEGCEYDIENGSTIILAHEAMHHNKAVWGANANEFVAGRFLDNRISNNAFRGFGGGANMCPGKGFATAQIVALVAMWVLQFDLEPIGGQWEEPGQDQSNMSRENTPALRKPIVEAFPRAGTENVVWRFRM